MRKKPRHQARPRLELLENRQLLSNTPSTALYVPPMMAGDGAGFSYVLTPVSATELTIVSLPTTVGERMDSRDLGRPGDGYAVWMPMSEQGPMGNDGFATAWRGDDTVYFSDFTISQYSFDWVGWQGYEYSSPTPPPGTVPLGDQPTPSSPSGTISSGNKLGDDSYSQSPPPLAPTRGSLLGQGTSATPTPAALANNTLVYDSPIDEVTIVVKVVSEPVVSASSNVLAVSEPSSLSAASAAHSQLGSLKQTGPVIPVSDATTSGSMHLLPSAGNVTTTPDRVVLVGSLPGATERRLADAVSASSPFITASSNPDDILAPGGKVATPIAPATTGADTQPPTADKDGNATEEATPALESTPLPQPQGAGLLDGELPLGLAGLESALRALTGTETTGRASSNLLMRCLALGSWLLSAALAWAVLRRQSSLPEAGLDDTLSLGRAGPPEEENP